MRNVKYPATIGAIILVLAGIVGLLLFTRLTQTTAPGTPITPPIGGAEGDAPLYMTVMTHMEGNFKDDVDKALFERHIDQLTWGMDLFDQYGGKITVESEQSFAKANTVWGRNFLKEIIERGHGVGTHADFGAEQPAKNMAFYIRALKANKALIDDLVGAKNNTGISGGLGAYDWVTAMAQAGFSHVDGTVGFAYLSMPLSERPNGWTDEYIRNRTYHDPAPVDFLARITPFDLANANDFTPDAKGVITISSGAIGELSSLKEGRINCSPNCKLTNEDIDVLFQAILDAHADRDRSAVAKLNVHMPLTLYKEEHEDVLRYFLSGLESYASQNIIVWGTQQEAYEGYVAQRD